jgi:hypothetical protein
LIYLWIVSALAFGIVTTGAILVRASGLKRRNLFVRDIFLVVVTPALLYIALIELVIMPSRGAQYASIYPIFMFWLAPAMLMLNRRLEIYFT